MKYIQNIIIFATLIGLIAYTIYQKQTQTDIQIPHNERFESENFNIELPDQFDFCGEAVPIKEQEVRERFDREMHVNVFWHSYTYLVIKRSNKWFPIIEPILEQHGIPNDFKYLTVTESALTNVVSHKGAVGFWQILAQTGKELGLRIDKEVDERYDPIKATHAACKFLKQGYKRFGNWTIVAASYNRGMAGMARAMKKQKVNSYYDLQLNDETSRYIFRILAFKEVMGNPEKYKFDIAKKNLYYMEPTTKVTVEESIPNLVDFALEQGINLKTLKVFNPWLRRDRLTVRDGESFTILIPKNKEAYNAVEEDEQEADSVEQDSISPKELDLAPH